MNVRELLATWERDVAQDAADTLVGDLGEVARRVARAAIVAPEETRARLAPRVDELRAQIRAEAGSLAALDLAGALAAIGFGDERVDLHVVARSELSGPQRVRLGLAALALDVPQVASVAAARRQHYVPGNSYPHDVRAALGHWIDALANGAELIDAQPAWRAAVLTLSSLFADEQLDEPSLLWMGRIIHARFARRPVAEVARRVHDDVWRIANEPPVVKRDKATAFPMGDTLGNGAFRVRSHLLGADTQRLFMGSGSRSPDEFLISVNNQDERDASAKLESRLAYRVPGVLELEHLGTWDQTGTDVQRDYMRGGYWGLVERLPAGTWLPHALAETHPPHVRERRAIAFGRSAGQILLAALKRGVLLHAVRTELMWQRDGHIVGLTDRPAALFALPRKGFHGGPAFERSYIAPEAIRDGSLVDERALTFTLAALVAEWATGRYPFERTYEWYWLSATSNPHLPLDVDPGLEAVLARALQRTPDRRPDLGDFLRELGKIVPKPRPHRL